MFPRHPWRGKILGYFDNLKEDRSMFWKKREEKPKSIVEEKPIIASLKKSLRRGFWQVKNLTHEHFSLHGL